MQGYQRGGSLSSQTNGFNSSFLLIPYFFAVRVSQFSSVTGQKTDKEKIQLVLCEVSKLSHSLRNSKQQNRPLGKPGVPVSSTEEESSLFLLAAAPSFKVDSHAPFKSLAGDLFCRQACSEGSCLRILLPSQYFSSLFCHPKAYIPIRDSLCLHL